MTRLILTLALLLPLALSQPAHAVEPDEILADSGLETRAREISKGLRCVVCQNQSIDDSNAEIARDLRILVRERLLLGDDNVQVVDYVVARYGEYVRLKPSFRPSTYPLWLGPP
ncbi:MAG: cytochrome c-type biogenesis protein, partial [Alphaproteobacteria bacterium]